MMYRVIRHSGIQVTVLSKGEMGERREEKSMVQKLQFGALISVDMNSVQREEKGRMTAKVRFKDKTRGLVELINQSGYPSLLPFPLCNNEGAVFDNVNTDTNTNTNTRTNTITITDTNII